MSKKRVLFATNYNGNDTTSYLRAWGPFTLMRDEVEIVEPILPKVGENLKYGWWSNWRSWWNNIDVCFMHRPFGKIAAHIMSQCKMHHIPLWVDHDDDLLEIPPQNPHYQTHFDGEKEFPSVEMSYKYANILTCSGEVMHEKLKTKYKRSDAILITSGLDDRLLRLKQPFKRNNKISWRGSTSHKSDLQFYEKPIERLIKRHSNKEFYFWGIDPQTLWPDYSDLPNWKFEMQLNFLDYITSLCRENAFLHFVPLEDNYFNRVKSNLAWLDATLAGSAVLGPEFPEWNRQGIATYHGNDLEDFEKMMERMIEFGNDEFHTLKNFHDQSWEYIKDCLLQSKLNEKRREILRNL